jgi:hypothetical protein
VNREIAGDDYRAACALSELKTRYLHTSMAELRRSHHARIPTTRPQTARTAETARTPKTARTAETARTPKTAQTAEPLIREALVSEQAAAVERKRPAWKDLPTRRLAAIGIATAGVLLVVGVGRSLLWGSDHARLNRNQLDQVSPYLSHGIRSENGQGPAFVGEIRNGWSALQASDQLLVATDLVEALREYGVRDVMIYDDDGLLRIQALGEQPARVLPGVEPGG